MILSWSSGRDGFCSLESYYSLFEKIVGGMEAFPRRAIRVPTRVPFFCLGICSGIRQSAEMRDCVGQ